MATDSSGNPVCVWCHFAHRTRPDGKQRRGWGVVGVVGSALSDSRSHYAAHEAAQELQLQPHVDENDEEEERGRVRRERKQLHTKQLKKKKKSPKHPERSSNLETFQVKCDV